MPSFELTTIPDYKSLTVTIRPRLLPYVSSFSVFKLDLNEDSFLLLDS